MNKILVTCLAVSLFTALSYAAVAGEAEESVRSRERSLSIKSSVLGEDVALRLYLPDSYDASETGCPVIYILEPGLYFRFMTGVADTYSRLGKMPESIVVGIATSDRWRDYTPTNADVPDGTKIPQSGGGEAFGRFLAEELIPYIDVNYRTRPYTVLCGHSLGGLAVIAELVSGRDAFDAFIATSPSLWWDGEVMTSRAVEGAAPGKYYGKKLFIACGSEGETVLGPIERFDETIISGSLDGLSWRYIHFAEADHQEMPVKAFSYGLDEVFAGWKLPSSVLEQGYDAVAGYYEELSGRFGYHIPVPEGVCNRLGYIALGKGDTGLAIDIFTKNTGEYPGSPNVWDSLAEAYMKDGDRVKALELYRKVLEIDPGSTNAKKMIEELEK